MIRRDYCHAKDGYSITYHSGGSVFNSILEVKNNEFTIGTYTYCLLLTNPVIKSENGDIINVINNTFTIDGINYGIHCVEYFHSIYDDYVKVPLIPVEPSPLVNNGVDDRLFIAMNTKGWVEGMNDVSTWIRTTSSSKPTVGLGVASVMIKHPKQIYETASKGEWFESISVALDVVNYRISRMNKINNSWGQGSIKLIK
jgi:hypothetical protein